MSLVYEITATAFTLAAAIVCVVVALTLIAAAYFETRAYVVRHRERVRLRRPPYDHQLRD